jgi:hypothetical protein
VITDHAGPRPDVLAELGIACRAYRSTVTAKPAIALYVLAMAAVIVAVDVLIFRGHFWPRLMVNVGIVLVFLAFYLRFVRH